MALEGTGNYFTGFADAWGRSLEQGRRQARQTLEDEFALGRLREEAQINRDIEEASRVGGGRLQSLAALGVRPPTTPTLAPPPQTPRPMGPDQAFGLENAGVPLAPQPSLAPPPPPPGLAPGAPPGAPAGPGPRRQSLLAEMDPALAGRLLRHPRGQAVIKTFQEAEKEQYEHGQREIAKGHFEEGSEALRKGDTLGYFDWTGRGFRALGDYAHAAKQTEFSMNIRGNKAEEQAAAADAAAVNRAKAAFEADPTPETRQGVLDALSGVKSAAWRGLNVKVGESLLKSTFDQNPQVMGFNRRVSSGYQSAFAEGKEPDAATIYREAAKADPAGFNAWVLDAMANQKALPDVVRKNVLRWEDVDVKDIPKDRYAWAWRRTQAQLPGVAQNDPRFLETLNKELAEAAKIEQRAKADEKATSPFEETRNLRNDVDAARKRLHDVRAELRNLRDPVKGTQDPAREQDLLEEEAAAKRDLEGYEGRMRKKAGLPGAGTGAATPKPRVLIPARPVPQKELKKGTESSNYRDAARAEISRLKSAGLTMDEVIAEMEKAGWR